MRNSIQSCYNEALFFPDLKSVKGNGTSSTPVKTPNVKTPDVKTTKTTASLPRPTTTVKAAEVASVVPVAATTAAPVMGPITVVEKDNKYSFHVSDFLSALVQ